MTCPWLCLITDRQRLRPDARTERDALVALERFLNDAFEAEIDLVQVRERDLEARVLVDLIRRLTSRAPSGARPVVLVNDRADVAHAGRAAGVHLRADAPPAARVRAIGPADWIVGRSVHTPDEAAAVRDADYLMCGTVFATTSKPAGSLLLGLEGLRAAAAAAAAPVLAIGGVTPARVAACREAGAAGVAAIGVFLPPGLAPEALGPAVAARAFRAAWG